MRVNSILQTTQKIRGRGRVIEQQTRALLVCFQHPVLVITTNLSDIKQQTHSLSGPKSWSTDQLVVQGATERVVVHGCSHSEVAGICKMILTRLSGVGVVPVGGTLSRCRVRWLHTRSGKRDMQATLREFEEQSVGTSVEFEEQSGPLFSSKTVCFPQGVFAEQIYSAFFPTKLCRSRDK